jgi:hypothetical protein
LSHLGRRVEVVFKAGFDMLASGIAGVIMMRVLPFADERALNVYRQFERGLYRSLKPD